MKKKTAVAPATNILVLLLALCSAGLLPLHSFAQSPDAVTGIITDYNGWWKTSKSSMSPVKPDNSHNLLAFTYHGVQYSTGVDDARLTSYGETYIPGDFWSLPSSGMTGTINGNTKIGLGAMFDGLFNGHGNFLPDYHISTYLSDGIKGLNIGTCVANLPAGSMTFILSDIQPSSIGDGIPDILVTQVADPTNNSYDRYQFTDASGNMVGSYKDIIFTNISPVGNWTADFFEAMPAAIPLALNFMQTDRPMRLWAADLSDFGITAANYSQIKNFKIQLNGNSDVAFVAYNNKSVNFQQQLPVNYTFFKGSLVDQQAQLKWQTTSEVNANNFIVERSADGNTFTQIGSIRAQNRPIVDDYTFTDATPLPGTGFYRIRQTDIDGRSSVSNVIKIRNEAHAELQLYPVPARTELFVQHPSAGDGETMTVYNDAGIVVAQVQAAKGSVQTRIGLQQLNDGAYYLVYNSQDGKTTSRFMVRK